MRFSPQVLPHGSLTGPQAEAIFELYYDGGHSPPSASSSSSSSSSSSQSLSASLEVSGGMGGVRTPLSSVPSTPRHSSSHGNKDLQQALSNFTNSSNNSFNTMIELSHSQLSQHSVEEAAVAEGSSAKGQSDDKDKVCVSTIFSLPFALHG